MEKMSFFVLLQTNVLRQSLLSTISYRAYMQFFVETDKESIQRTR